MLDGFITACFKIKFISFFLGYSKGYYLPGVHNNLCGFFFFSPASRLDQGSPTLVFGSYCPKGFQMHSLSNTESAARMLSESAESVKWITPAVLPKSLAKVANEPLIWLKCFGGRLHLKPAEQ